MPVLFVVVVVVLVVLVVVVVEVLDVVVMPVEALDDVVAVVVVVGREPPDPASPPVPVGSSPQAATSAIQLMEESARMRRMGDLYALLVTLLRRRKDQIATAGVRDQPATAFGLSRHG